MNYFETIEEKEARLKYFYFINSDIIKHRIRTEFQENSKEYDSIEKKFLYVFSEVQKASAPYSEYILSEDRYLARSFFGERLDVPEVNQSFQLSGISLFHHCVIYGLTKKLYQKVSTSSTSEIMLKNLLNFSSPHSVIKLSASTTTPITKGFKYCLDNSIDHTTLSKADDISHKKFNKMCQDLCKKETAYSRLLLKSMNHIQSVTAHFDADKKRTTDSQFYLLKHQSSGGLFLLESPVVRDFNKALQHFHTDKNSFNKLLKKYDDLLCSIDHKSHQTYEDSIFFNTVLEDAYGFTFFSYFLNAFSELQKNNYINFLFGANFYNLVGTLASKTPTEYNKSIFIKYALTSLSHSNSVTPSFPRIQEHAITYEPTYKKSPSIWGTDAMKQLNSFYRMLNQVTIPLLEDIWDTVTSDIFTLDEYSSFIAQFYNVISFDYSQIPILNIFKKRQTPNYYATYHALIEHVSKAGSNQIRKPSYNPENMDDSKKDFLASIFEYNFSVLPQTSAVDLISRMQPTYPTNDRIAYNRELFFKQYIENICNFSSNL